MGNTESIPNPVVEESGLKNKPIPNPATKNFEKSVEKSRQPQSIPQKPQIEPPPVIIKPPPPPPPPPKIILKPPDIKIKPPDIIIKPPDIKPIQIFNITKPENTVLEPERGARSDNPPTYVPPLEVPPPPPASIPITAPKEEPPVKATDPFVQPVNTSTLTSSQSTSQSTSNTINFTPTINITQQEPAQPAPVQQQAPVIPNITVNVTQPDNSVFLQSLMQKTTSTTTDIFNNLLTQGLQATNSVTTTGLNNLNNAFNSSLGTLNNGLNQGFNTTNNAIKESGDVLKLGITETNETVQKGFSTFESSLQTLSTNLLIGGVVLGGGFLYLSMNKPIPTVTANKNI